MPGSPTTPGRPGARTHAPVRVAFRDLKRVGARNKTSFAAQWLAYALPCRRFACTLTNAGARLTATMIDSRDFLQARRRAETEVLLPKGAKIAFAGGVECNDHHRIGAALDRVRTKHPDMVLLHGGTPRGAEKIAACWANSRKVPQIVFKPDWARHAKAAPFKRNDQLLEALPIGVVVFPGSGVTDNLADKARKLGIPLFDFRKTGGG